MRGQTQTEFLQQIVRQYREAGQPWPATTRQIAGWAMRKELWSPPRDTVLGYFSEQLARAMREEYYTDPQGRSVRLKHAARVLLHGEQLMLWDDIRTADPTHMRNALQLRR